MGWEIRIIYKNVFIFCCLQSCLSVSLRTAVLMLLGYTLLLQQLTLLETAQIINVLCCLEFTYPLSYRGPYTTMNACIRMKSMTSLEMLDSGLTFMIHWINRTSKASYENDLLITLLRCWMLISTKLHLLMSLELSNKSLQRTLISGQSWSCFYSR